MKVALVCDWLTTPGGAEKVLLELHHMYPDAPIYTSQYRPKGIDWFRDADVRTGWLNFFPAVLRKYIGLFRQIYFSHLDLSSYDLVISVTGAEAKSVRTCNAVTSSKAFHLCYCHVPTQYYWQFYDQYIANPGFGILNPIARLGLKLLVKPLRKADYRAAQRPDQFVTISRYAAEQIQKYYHRDAKVVFPPVDLSKFALKRSSKRSGFVISCRQVTWKRVDLAIQACLAAQLPLTVIGDGPEHANLVRLAGGSPLIKFIPWVESAALAGHLQKSAAYIFPSIEPFGIAPVEALAAGCPVIAYADGGSRDIVVPGKNGLLFSEQSVDSLVKALKRFDASKFDSFIVSQSAEKFATSHFVEGITKLTKARGQK